MNKSELLQRFVQMETGFRDYLRTPFLLGEFVYATNGHVAVRVPRDGLDYKEIENGKVREIGDLFAKSTRDTWTDIPTLPERIPCKHCNGSAVQVECDDCDGNGEFDHGMHTYECQKCRGSGQVTGRVGKQQPCNNCDGTGAKSNQPVAVGEASYDRRYLAKIIDLPNIKFSPTLYENGPGYFVFDGGEGLLMPMRV